MNNIEIIKQKYPNAQFFKKGAIIPQRVLRGKRKHKHLVVFDSDSLVINGKDGYVVLFVDAENNSAIQIKVGIKNYHLLGSVYHKKAGTYFIGNIRGVDKQIEDAEIFLNWGTK